MRFTIVTVCYNAESTIEDTIKSVICQSCRDYEYLIIDGASKDRTLDIIKHYSELVPQIKYISEPDKGLYDAMNKGVKLAIGEYVEFLNSGDRLYDENVLKRLSDVIEEDGTKAADIYYGDIIYCYSDGHTARRNYGKICGNRFYYLLGDCINHQSIFASRESLTAEGRLSDQTDASQYDVNPFNTTRYRYCADRDWMLRCKKNGMKFKSTGILICRYSLDENSQSVVNEKQAWTEAKDIVKRQLPLGYPIYLLVDSIRNSRRLSALLHRVYEMVFIRK